MNLRSLFLIFVVMVMMCGSASAATINITEDSYISSTASGTNFGDVALLSVRSEGGGVNESFSKFTMPEYGTNVTFHFYAKSAYSSTLELDFYRTASTWEEDSIDDSNDPTRGSTLGQVTGINPTGSGYAWYSIDITDYNTKAFLDPGIYTIRYKPVYGDKGNVYSRESEYYPYITYDAYDAGSNLVKYVDFDTGDDNNSGNVGEPFATMETAFLNTVQNQTIYVSGSYDYGSLGMRINNVVSDNVTIIGIGTPSITSANTTATILLGTTGIAGTVPGELTIRNFVINNTYNTASDTIGGVIFAQSSASNNVTIDDCTINAISTGVGINYNTGNGTAIVDTVINARRKNGIFMEVTSLYGMERVNITNVIANGSMNRLASDSGNGVIIKSGGTYSKYLTNSRFENISIYYATYTGFKNGATYGNIYKNITIYSEGYGHNAFEPWHPWAYYEDIGVLGSNYSWIVAGNPLTSPQPFYGPGSEWGHNVTIIRPYSNDTFGRLFTLFGHNSNILVKDGVHRNHNDTGFTVGAIDAGQDYMRSANIVFANITLDIIKVPTAGYQEILPLGSVAWSNISEPELYTRDNLTFIDVNNTHISDSKPEWVLHSDSNLYWHGDVYLMNVRNTSTSWSVSTPETMTHAYVRKMYYLNLNITDINGNPVENATVTFEANISHPDGSVLRPHNKNYVNCSKAFTDDIVLVVTDNNGQLNYDNESTVFVDSSIAWYNSTTYAHEAYVEWNVTATYDGTSNSTIITPDMLRYSPDSADIQSDLVTVTLDVTVSEDHDNEYVAVVFAGLSFVGLYFANRFRRR